MDASRRRFVTGFAAALAAGPWTLDAQATRTPLALSRLLCGYPPGGSIDVVCRAVAAEMTGKYARSVIVENKPGAAGRIVVDEVKRAQADGGAMLVTPASVLTMYPYVYRSLTYDPLADLVPVSMLASFGFVLVVGPKVPSRILRLDDYFAWCRANPDFADCGNAGAGSLPHFMAVIMAHDAAIGLTHVPYKGSSAALLDCAAGQVGAVFATEPSAIQLVSSGRVRALATSWDLRSPFLPQVPTFKEHGLQRMTQREWFGAFLPRGANASLVDFANSELAAASRASDVQGALRNSALRPEGSTALELQTAVRAEHGFWAAVVKASGFTPES